MKKILLALLTVAVVLTSCGPAKTEIELYYYKQENQDGLKLLVNEFQKDNPNISVKLLVIPNDADSAMSTRASQGELPAIMQMQSYARVQEYASKGYLVDLSGTEVISKVVDSALPAVTYDGKPYALPMDFAGIGIIYNKDIFADLGLEPPETYDELEVVCEELQAAGIVPFAALLKENWSVGHFITMIHTALLQDVCSYDDFIAGMNSGDLSYGCVDTNRLFSILDFYGANMNSNAAEMDGAAQQRSFGTGEAAMMVQGLWGYIDAMKVNPDLNAGFIPFPVFNDPAKNKLYADVDSCFGISAQASEEEKAAAMAFLDWLSSEKGQKLWVENYKLTLSFKGADVSSLGGPYDDMMASVGEKGSLPWLFSQYPTVVFEDACKNGAQQYMLKSKTASQVIADIDSQWAAATK